MRQNSPPLTPALSWAVIDRFTLDLPRWVDALKSLSLAKKRGLSRPRMQELTGEVELMRDRLLESARGIIAAAGVLAYPMPTFDRLLSCVRENGEAPDVVLTHDVGYEIVRLRLRVMRGTRLNQQLPALRVMPESPVPLFEQHTARGQTKKEQRKGPTHSEGFQVVFWPTPGVPNPPPHRFNPTQARCVEILWAAWVRGESVHQQTIWKALESDNRSFKLLHVFRVVRTGKTTRHPAWGSMIVKASLPSHYTLAGKYSDWCEEIPSKSPGITRKSPAGAPRSPR